jgi:hypothetical protein
MKALAVAILAVVALLSIGTAANARVVAFEDNGAAAYMTPVIDSVPVQADDYLATWAMGPLLAQ